MVERMDKCIGDVLKQIEAMGAAANTIVVFTSDNGGDPNGRNKPFKGLKSSVSEGGIRVPLHIRWPTTIPAGREVSQVSMTMDLAPTLLAAAGVRGGQFDGIDLMPFIAAKAAPSKRTVFWRYKRAKTVRKAVRHGDWKYTDDNGVKALYDLAADPVEQNNLLDTRPDMAKDFQDRLTKWEKDVKAQRIPD
jgi:arylsulfatase A